jgi:hypothetical protein
MTEKFSFLLKCTFFYDARIMSLNREEKYRTIDMDI